MSVQAQSNRPLTEYVLTCGDVAKKLGYHVQYVRYLASKGKLPAIKRFRQWLFSEGEILNFLKSLAKNGDAKDGTVRHQDGSDDVLS